MTAKPRPVVRVTAEWATAFGRATRRVQIERPRVRRVKGGSKP